MSALVNHSNYGCVDLVITYAHVNRVGVMQLVIIGLVIEEAAVSSTVIY